MNKKLLLSVLLSFSVVSINCMKRKATNNNAYNSKRAKIEDMNVSSINKIYENGRTLLHLYATNGNLELAELLVAKGANVDVQDDSGNTPLCRAVQNGHLNIAQLLLQNGANANVKNNIKWRPIHIAANNGDKDMVKLLLAYNARTDVFTCDSQIPLHRAVNNGNVEVAELLTDDIPGITFDYREWNPIHYAIFKDDIKMVKLLLKNGFTGYDESSDGPSALSLVKNQKMLNLLVSTPDIFNALYSNDIELFKSLIKEGHNINSKTLIEDSLLSLAVQERKKQIAELLIEAGAKKDIINSEGVTAFDHADPEFSELLNYYIPIVQR